MPGSLAEYIDEVASIVKVGSDQRISHPATHAPIDHFALHRIVRSASLSRHKVSHYLLALTIQGRASHSEKSRRNFSRNGPPEPNIVMDFELLWPTPEQFEIDVRNLSRPLDPGQPPNNVQFNRLNVNQSHESLVTDRDLYLVSLKAKDKRWMSAYFFRLFQIKLDGRTRFVLTDDRDQEISWGRRKIS